MCLGLTQNVNVSQITSNNVEAAINWIVEHGDELQEDPSSRHASVSSQDFVIVREEHKMVRAIFPSQSAACRHQFYCQLLCLIRASLPLYFARSFLYGQIWTCPLGRLLHNARMLALERIVAPAAIQPRSYNGNRWVYSCCIHE